MARTFTAKKSKSGKIIECGRCSAPIVPGESYYYFSVGFRGSKQYRCKLHAPKPSETCGSKLSGAYAAAEGLIEVVTAALKANSLEGVVDAIDEAIGEIDSVREEYETYADEYPNLAENAGTQDTISSLQEYTDSLDSAKMEIEEAAEDDGTSDQNPVVSALESLESAIGDYSF